MDLKGLIVMVSFLISVDLIYVLFVYIMFFKLVQSYQKLIQPVPT